MEWTVVTVIIALAGLMATVGAPVIKLNGTIVKLNATIITLDKIHILSKQQEMEL